MHMKEKEKTLEPTIPYDPTRDLERNEPSHGKPIEQTRIPGKPIEAPEKTGNPLFDSVHS